MTESNSTPPGKKPGEVSDRNQESSPEVDGSAGSLDDQASNRARSDSNASADASRPGRLRSIIPGILGGMAGAVPALLLFQYLAPSVTPWVRYYDSMSEVFESGRRSIQAEILELKSAMSDQDKETQAEIKSSVADLREEVFSQDWVRSVAWEKAKAELAVALVALDQKYADTARVSGEHRESLVAIGAKNARGILALESTLHERFSALTSDSDETRHYVQGVDERVRSVSLALKNVNRESKPSSYPKEDGSVDALDWVSRLEARVLNLARNQSALVKAQRILDGTIQELRDSGGPANADIASADLTPDSPVSKPGERNLSDRFAEQIAGLVSEISSIQQRLDTTKTSIETISFEPRLEKLELAQSRTVEQLLQVSVRTDDLRGQISGILGSVRRMRDLKGLTDQIRAGIPYDSKWSNPDLSSYVSSKGALSAFRTTGLPAPTELVIRLRAIQLSLDHASEEKPPLSVFESMFEKVGGLVRVRYSDVKAGSDQENILFHVFAILEGGDYRGSLSTFDRLPESIVGTPGSKSWRELVKAYVELTELESVLHSSFPALDGQARPRM